MWRLAVLVTATIIGVTLFAAAGAQQAPTQPATRTAPQGPQVTVAPSTIRAPPTYVELQQQNRQLTQQLAAANQQLTRTRQQYVGLQQQNQSLRTQIAQMTSQGGSLVRAYCANTTTSRNTAGAQMSCDRYLCEPVSGLCRNRCSVTAECAPGYYCNDAACVPP